MGKFTFHHFSKFKNLLFFHANYYDFRHLKGGLADTHSQKIIGLAGISGDSCCNKGGTKKFQKHDENVFFWNLIRILNGWLLLRLFIRVSSIPGVAARPSLRDRLGCPLEPVFAD
jgi:hypothetical protein